jgi:hypothetical protein
MQDIWHQSLEPHILHTSNHLRRFEVLVSGIASSFTEIIDQVSKVKREMRNTNIQETFEKALYLVTSPNARPSLRK